MLENIKETFVPLPKTLPMNNLQELCCDQGRCYYTPKFHAPYKEKLTCSNVNC